MQVTIEIWHVLVAVTVISGLFIFNPSRQGGIIPLPDLINTVILIFANLLMWLIYFIIN